MSDSALTAACLVGEVRGLIYPQVHSLLRRNVLHSINADTFLVYTRAWSQWQLSRESNNTKHEIYVRAGFDRIPAEATIDQMATIISVLKPVAAEETNDNEVLQRADGSKGWLPVPLQQLSDTSLCADAIGPNPHTATCLFALRCVRCLQLIERAEAKRGSQYAWVLRARPDVFVGCRMRLPASIVHPKSNSSRWAVFYWDYLAFMPRPSAAASLGDGHRASFPRHSANDTMQALCQRGSTGGSIACNPCHVRSRFGLDLIIIDLENFGLVDIARQCALKSWEMSRSAAMRKNAGFATKAGRCHPSIKVLAGPDLSVYEGMETECTRLETLRPNYVRHVAMGFVLTHPDCVKRKSPYSLSDRWWPSSNAFEQRLPGTLSVAGAS